MEKSNPKQCIFDINDKNQSNEQKIDKKRATLIKTYILVIKLNSVQNILRVKQEKLKEEEERMQNEYYFFYQDD